MRTKAGFWIDPEVRQTATQRPEKLSAKATHANHGLEDRSGTMPGAAK
jgi:hypothetical protein